MHRFVKHHLWLLAFAGNIAQSESASVSEPVPDPVPLHQALSEISRAYDIHFIHSRVDLSSHQLINTELTDNSIEQSLTQWLEPIGLEWRWLNPQTIELFNAAKATKSLPPEQPTLEQLEVLGHRATGSLLHPEQARAWPISATIDSSLLATGQAQSKAEKLQRWLPQVSGHSVNSHLSNGGSVSASLNLRGLPSEYSLVLIDGLRVAPTMRNAGSVDLNTLPTAMASTIQLHASGASSIYGADAVAGALNYQLDRSTEGLAITLGTGISSRDDLATDRYNIRWGSDWQTGKLLVGTSFFQQDGLMSHQRQLSADQRSQGGADLRSSAIPNGRFYFPDGQVLTAEPNDLGEHSYRPATAEDKYDYAEQTSAVLPMKLHSHYGYLEYPINDSLSTSLSLHHSTNTGSNTRAAQPLVSNTGYPSWEFSPDNRFNHFVDAPVSVRRRLVELGPRQLSNQRQLSNASWRLGQSIEIADQPWHWHSVLHYSQARNEQQFNNLVSRNRLALAAGPDDNCEAEPDCLAINLLAPAGSIDAASINYISASEAVDEQGRLAELSVQLDGPIALMNSQINTAFGFLHRYEDSLQNFIGTDTELDSHYRGQRQLTEVFTEANSAFYQDRLEFSGAVRVSMDRDLGTVISPNLDVSGWLTDSVSVRAGTGAGYRAPSLFEQHSENFEFSSRLQDPCSQPERLATLPGCQGLADNSQLQFITLLSGNDQLEPETTQHWRAGLTWQPEILQASRIQIDYINTKIDQVITAASAQSVVEQSVLSEQSSALGGQVVRNAQGSIQWVETQFINYGQRAIEAIDINTDVQWQSMGQWSWQTLASYLIRYQDLSSPERSASNLAGHYEPHSRGGNDGLPKWQVSSLLNWSSSHWQLGYELLYVDSMMETIPYSDDQRRIDSWLTHNLSVSFKPPSMSAITLTLAIDNVFDESQPFVASSFNNGLDANLHSLQGRYISGQIGFFW